MLVQYQVVRKKRDVILSLKRDVESLSADLNQLIPIINRFGNLISSGDIQDACEDIKEFHIEIKELEKITESIRGNFEDYVRSLVPYVEDAEEEDPEEIKKSLPETDKLTSLVGAIDALNKMKEMVDR